MQIFELHFNPKAEEDLIFDSFCYTPANVYEKRLGGLYLVGELKNALPQNFRLLDNLAKIIKGKFYGFPVQSIEESLKESLKRANEFLEQEVKKDNTSWLGNLNFAVISLKNFNLNFTKFGDLKILLLREGQIVNIGRRLELQEIEPYPLKVFLNVVSGKLSREDIIFISTKEVFDLFSRENLVDEIAQIPVEEKFSEKKLKKILKNKEKILSEISGVCLLIVLKPEFLLKRALSFEKEVPVLQIGKIFKPLVTKITTWKSTFRNIWKSAISSKISKEKLKISPKVSPQKILKKLSISPKIKFSKDFKKKLILIFALIFFLLLGFFIFKRRKEVSLRETQNIFSEIQAKINLAGDFLILKDEEKANSILKEAWEEILPLIEIKHPLKNEILALKESIEENLQNLNKLEKITTPKILFEFSEKEFLPQKIVGLDKVLYFFNPYSKDLYKFEEGEKIKIETNQKFNKAVPFDKDSILFFLEPDKLIFLKEDRFGEIFSLKSPYPDFSCNDLSVFRRNIYFLDEKTGEVIRYSSPLETYKDFPKFWLNPETKKVTDAKSIAIDGSIWILNRENNIDRFYLGEYQETLILDFFPYSKNIEKILINQNLPYLFLMEPEQSRIIILNKSGQIISQFQSEKFDNLKDFAVSEDGIIYLLNGLKIYQIKLQ
ncbi:hypothetical protein KJA14_01490 [Patescibacteria group bacterium]|nr:hypothetical protein [Patescibacteria group bacterium]